MSPLLDLAGWDGLAWPWMLAAIVLPLLWRWLLPRARGADSPALRVPWEDRVRHVAAGAGGFALPRARRLPWLAWLAWICLCVAAARPQQLGPPVAPPQAGRDMMLAVDLSASMGEQDMELGSRLVDRLTAAKAVLADFLDRRAGDRIGLIVFGDRAYALTPLTLDRDSVRQQLQSMELGLAGRATALGDGIGLAVKRLQAQREDRRVLIVLTDGVNTAGMLEPVKAAEVARDSGVRIYTIAFGGDARGVNLFGFQLPLGGDDVDESGLQRVAQLTGGRFYRARDTRSLADIYAQIDQLEPVPRQAQAVRPRIERYPAPLAAGLGLALLAGLLRRRA